MQIRQRALASQVTRLRLHLTEAFSSSSKGEGTLETGISRNNRSPAPTPPDVLHVPPGMARLHFRAMGTTISFLKGKKSYKKYERENKMSIWQTVTWDVARAGGFTAFCLLTLSVAIGLALSLHLQSPRWPRIINSELHNFLTLLALIFTGVHILAVWVDPFTRFGWNEVFLPFASHYRTVWMALGIVAFYIGIAIGISTWLRPRIGYKVWRALHTLTLLLFGLVVVHGIATGSDTRTSWGAAMYASSVVLVGTLLWMRLRKPLNAKSRAHPVLAVAVVVFVAVGTVLGAAWSLATRLGLCCQRWHSFGVDKQTRWLRHHKISSNDKYPFLNPSRAICKANSRKVGRMRTAMSPCNSI